MTPEAQRIAIAGACGWKYREIRSGYESEGWFWCNGEERLSKLPDYLNDLNAMHEAVQSLRRNGDQFQWLQYQQELFRVVWGRYFDIGEDYFGSELTWDVIEATAAQRAEAFLKAIGKWVDSDNDN